MSLKKFILAIFLFVLVVCLFVFVLLYFYGFNLQGIYDRVFKRQLGKEGSYLSSSIKRASFASFSKNASLDIKNKAKVIKRSKEDESNYKLGVGEAEGGNWEMALVYWDKIDPDSYYYHKIIDQEYVPHLKPSGELVYLLSYRLAKDPNWDELLAFLQKDDTDENEYREEEFVCTNFAQGLHNNAERSGLKTAYIGADFSEGPGHALNAFNTIDRGLVYVDVTGRGDSYIREDFLNEESDNCEWDKIAYLENGSDYGTVSISYESIDPTSYSFFEGYKGLWDEAISAFEQFDLEILAYNSQVEKHKSEIVSFDKQKQEYESSVSEYNEKLKRGEASINSEHINKRADLDAKFDAWEVDKLVYETKTADFNSRVEEYNTGGEGDPAELQQESKDLEAEREELNSQLDSLRNEAKSLEDEINSKIDLKKQEFEPLKQDLDKKLADLESYENLINQEGELLSNQSTALNTKMASLKQQEEDLGVCYWKSLGRVVAIEIYW